MKLPKRGCVRCLATASCSQLDPKMHLRYQRQVSYLHCRSFYSFQFLQEGSVTRSCLPGEAGLREFGCSSDGSSEPAGAALSSGNATALPSGGLVTNRAHGSTVRSGELSGVVLGNTMYRSNTAQSL